MPNKEPAKKGSKGSKGAKGSKGSKGANARNKGNAASKISTKTNKTSRRRGINGCFGFLYKHIYVLLCVIMHNIALFGFVWLYIRV